VTRRSDNRREVNGQREYRLLAERALGHPLPTHAIVHHHTDTQLVICQDQAYHVLLHRRMRILRAGGNPNTDAWCSRCQRPRPLHLFYRRRTANRSQPVGSLTTVCRECMCLYGREKYGFRPRETLRHNLDEHIVRTLFEQGYGHIRITAVFGVSVQPVKRVLKHLGLRRPCPPSLR
jgi:hypothetical protein